MIEKKIDNSIRLILINKLRFLVVKELKWKITIINNNGNEIKKLRNKFNSLNKVRSHLNRKYK